MSVKSDAGPCYWQSSGVPDFWIKCAAPKNPVSRVYTEDYVSVETGCTQEPESVATQV
jgi:hypothetical protein